MVTDGRQSPTLRHLRDTLVFFLSLDVVLSFSRQQPKVCHCVCVEVQNEKRSFFFRSRCAVSREESGALYKILYLSSNEMEQKESGMMCFFSISSNQFGGESNSSYLLNLNALALMGSVKTRGCIQDVETETSVCFISSFIQPVGGFPFLFN